MQYGVLFLLINSHSTQNTAVGKLMKLMSCPVSFSAIRPIPPEFFASEFRKVNGSAMLQKWRVWFGAVNNDLQLACAVINSEGWLGVGNICRAGVNTRSRASAKAAGNSEVSRLISNCNSRSLYSR